MRIDKAIKVKNLNVVIGDWTEEEQEKYVSSRLQKGYLIMILNDEKEEKIKSLFHELAHWLLGEVQDKVGYFLDDSFEEKYCEKFAQIVYQILNQMEVLK